ncbi:MAG: hypothetical protein RBR77_04330 [Thauera sp.]|nr:hypothetical protein [Thauera sp.]
MSEYTQTCQECGMPVQLGEYHPFAACLMFKACRNGKMVRDNLEYVTKSWFDMGKREGEQRAANNIFKTEE